MGQVQIIGLIILVIGISLFYMLNSTNWSLLGAALIGFGTGVILVGRIGIFKKE